MVDGTLVVFSLSLLLFAILLPKMLRLLSSGKTPIPIRDMPQAQPFPSQRRFQVVNIQSPSEKSLGSIPRTFAIRPLLLGISPNGQIKACCSGTQSRLAKQANRFRTTGTNTHILQRKSFSGWQKGPRSSVFWGQFPDGTWKAFRSPRALRFARATHLPGAPSTPKHLSSARVSSQP